MNDFRHDQRPPWWYEWNEARSHTAKPNAAAPTSDGAVADQLHRADLEVLQSDNVQSLEEWMADLAAGRDYVSQWEDEHGPIRAAAEDRADYADHADNADEAEADAADHEHEL